MILTGENRSTPSETPRIASVYTDHIWTGLGCWHAISGFRGALDRKVL